MVNKESGDPRPASYVPTFAGYSEGRLRAILTTLDPEDPHDTRTRVVIEQRLVLFAAGE